MKKNNLKNIAVLLAVLALVFGVTSSASANNGADKGWSMNPGQAKKVAEFQKDAARKIANGDKEAEKDLLKIGDAAFNNAFRAARDTFNKQIKDAKKVYKQDKKTAHDALVASIKSANNNQDAINQAFNVYRNALVAALEKMYSSEQVAFNQFITALKNLTINPVTPVNHVPVAYSQTIKVLKNTILPITLSGSDPDKNVLTYSIVSSPAHGILSSAGVDQKYVPNKDFTGSDSFTFKVNDGSLDSPIATVYIEVVN